MPDVKENPASTGSAAKGSKSGTKPKRKSSPRRRPSRERTDQIITEFKAAGLLCYRYHGETKEAQVLVGLNNQREVELLGGKRDGKEKSDATAVREFDEETGQCLSDKSIAAVTRLQKRVLWIPKGKYALFVLHANKAGKAAEEFDALPKTFKSFRQNPGPVPRELLEMREILWIPLKELLKDRKGAKKISNFAKIVRSTPAFASWAKGVLSESKLINQNWRAVEMKNICDKIRKMKEKAQSEIPKLRRDKKKVDRKIPEVKSSLQLPTDIVVLDKSSADYKQVIQKTNKPGAVTCIKKINNPQRTQRFRDYVATLGSRYQSTMEVYHGTPKVEWANNISRTGPEISRAGTTSGVAYGQGFYTAQQANVSESYAGSSGSLCLCTAAPGRMKSSGSSSDTAGSLAAGRPPFDSTFIESSGYLVLYHPDSIVVNYIIDFGTGGSGLSQKQILAQKALEAKKQQRDVAEKVRIGKLNKIQARLRMIDIFCKRLDEMKRGLDESNVIFRSRLVQLESQQFEHGLPMYARKDEFIRLISNAQAIVLKGGTGIGKTVTCPQWMLDAVLSQPNDRMSQKPVAVLVPRKAIAQGLSKYISMVRGVELGQEVGLGCGDEVKLSDKTKLAFFTYGFFRAISTSDKNLSKWGCVVLDEAHERNPDADYCFTIMGRACCARPEFKAVVMSATIDVKEFADKMSLNVTGSKEAVPRSPLSPVEMRRAFSWESHDDEVEYTGTKHCPVIVVPGVTFPVEDVWFSSPTPWDPAKDSAIGDLVVEVLRIFNKEKTGNLLVFLSTIRGCNDAVEATKKMLLHDKNVIVKPLYAALPMKEKERIEDFVDYRKFPNNKGKRLICYSTNVAEAGITIKGVTAVVETGREMQVTFDPDLQCNVFQQGWISQASQLQRRGRAGRTAPGRCYCMYTKEDFDRMPKYSIPQMLKMDCTPFYLGLVASGMNPEDSKLQDAMLSFPKKRMAKARELLDSMQIIEFKDNVPKLTQVGQAINGLPLSVSLSKCIVSAAKFGCSFPVLQIACLVQVCESSRLFSGSFDEQNAAKDHFRMPSGDHETFLNVYEEWMDQPPEKRKAWADREHVNHAALKRASALMRKVQRRLQRVKVNRIPLLVPKEDEDRSDLIVKALAAGLAHNTAAAKDKSRGKEGFHLVEGHQTNPTLLRVHPVSSLDLSGSIPFVVFQSRTLTRKGDVMITGVTKATESQIIKANEVVNTVGSWFDDFKTQIRNMATVNKTVGPFTGSRHTFNAVSLNIRDLKRAYPLASIKLRHQDAKSTTQDAKSTPGRRRGSPGRQPQKYKYSVAISAEKSIISTVVKDVTDAINSAADAKVSIKLGIKSLSKWGTEHKRKPGVLYLGKEGKSMLQAVKDTFDLNHVVLSADFKTGTLTVECLAIMIDEVKAEIEALAAASIACRYFPSCTSGDSCPFFHPTTTGSVGVPGELPSTSPLRPVAMAASEEEKTRMSMLFNPRTTVKQIVKKFGPGRDGSYLVVAHTILHRTNMWLYGGFIRDFLFRGDMHDTMDIDVGLPHDWEGEETTPQHGRAKLKKVLAERKLGMKEQRTQYGGTYVIGVFYSTFDGKSTVEVQFVDAHHFAENDSKIDFDVNNFRTAKLGAGSFTLSKKYKDEPGELEGMASNCRAKRMVVHKPPREISARLSKMKTRGWGVLGFLQR